MTFCRYPPTPHNVEPTQCEQLSKQINSFDYFITFHNYFISESSPWFHKIQSLVSLKCAFKYFYMIMLVDGKDIVGKYSRPVVLSFGHMLEFLGELLKSLHLQASSHTK